MSLQSSWVSRKLEEAEEENSRCSAEVDVEEAEQSGFRRGLWGTIYRIELPKNIISSHGLMMFDGYPLEIMKS